MMISICLLVVAILFQGFALWHLYKEVGRLKYDMTTLHGNVGGLEEQAETNRKVVYLKQK